MPKNFRRLRFILILTMSYGMIVHAQHQVDDSTSAGRPRSLSDTTRKSFIIPIPLVGTLDRNLSSQDILTDSAKGTYDYRSFTDLLTFSPGVFTREFGSPGQFPDVTVRGLGAREIGYFYDGISLNDPLFGVFDPYLLPTEQIDRLEYISGSEASLYGLNSTGGAVNILSKSKKALHPFSQLRYSEGANGYSFVDGMVSQDILRGMNITAGAQHQTFGPWYPNTDFDAWNGRFKIRYSVSSHVEFFASELYNKTQLNLSSGVDLLTPDSARFDQRQATMRNTDAYEKIGRHDVRAGGAFKLLPDTDAVTTATFYLSSSLREFRDEENRPNPNGILLQQDERAQWMGLKIDQVLSAGSQSMDVGAEIQSQRTLVTPAIDEHRNTEFDLYGKAALSAADILSVTPFARVEQYLGQKKLGYGVDGTLSAASGISFFGGYARSYRFPTVEERYGLDTVLTSSLSDESVEQHDAFEGGLRIKSDDASFEISGFHRIILNPIVVASQSAPGTSSPYEFVQLAKETLRGITASARVRFSSFYVEGTGQFLDRRNDQDDTVNFPRWTGTAGIYYWDKLFKNHLNLKAGVRARGFSEYVGKEFNQQGLVYLPGGEQSAVPATAIIDLVVLAQISDATLHFIWENFLDRQYIMTSFYPMPGRQIRFGVTWIFTD
ncbi:MAG TPA: TonB-dependent receptor [Bacteroidota bacterium]|nr:TonB-dependent receptor [Bacteroidota bacterium]